MDLDPGSWGGLELGLKIGPMKTSIVEYLIYLPGLRNRRSMMVIRNLISIYVFATL